MSGDDYWRRPEPGDAAAGAESTPSGYPGPPRTGPAAPDRQPAWTAPHQPPRRLPELDHDELDRAEQRADRFTYAVALAAGVVLLIVACAQWRT
ncbi:translation initiation factor 2 [Catellatospora sp. KI3]|uniref:translation initiation factor 2 n=1 Tax=Catellatospora sp. KI3 TaxID=3041620 RepID=UPI002482F7B2|nr:translation initiation factor 2 [Catellatospora sp. KI3]MDI1460024.1 translation initiation factor 2 [Catellatospora sp. KI3]